jgi:cell wall assembly regulator SMI1
LIDEKDLGNGLPEQDRYLFASHDGLAALKIDRKSGMK